MSDRFDRNQLANDVSIAISSGLSRAAKVSVIDWACWRWTGSSGKYCGCPYWSRAALAELSTRGPGRWGEWCRHEHVVPRVVISEKLLALPDPTPPRIHEVLGLFAIGCVVTIDEDRRLSRGMRTKMPAAFGLEGHAMFQNAWARYREAGIEWVGPLEWRGNTPLR